MAKELETRGKTPLMFCAELYRSADFFMLKPLYKFVERYLGNYLDDRIKWLYTFGNALDDFYKEQKARAWVDDLKEAILEAERWNTPVITNMLKEFVWAARGYFVGFLCTARSVAHAPHIHIKEWLDNNTEQFMDRAESLCGTPVWRTESTDPI